MMDDIFDEDADEEILASKEWSKLRESRLKVIRKSISICNFQLNAWGHSSCILLGSFPCVFPLLGVFIWPSYGQCVPQIVSALASIFYDLSTWLSIFLQMSTEIQDLPAEGRYQLILSWYLNQMYTLI